MSTPLIDRPHMQTLLGLLRREGWAVPLFALFFIRGVHGLSAAFHAIFLVRKSDISYGLVYSRHDLWVLHSGLLSITSAFIFIFVIVRWIRFHRNTVRNQPRESNKRQIEQGGDGDAAEAVRSILSFSPVRHSSNVAKK